MDEVFVADGAKVVIAGRRQFSKRTSNEQSGSYPRLPFLIKPLLIKPLPQLCAGVTPV